MVPFTLCMPPSKEPKAFGGFFVYALFMRRSQLLRYYRI
jgi:hypothetical protein